MTLDSSRELVSGAKPESTSERKTSELPDALVELVADEGDGHSKNRDSVSRR
jgi:hypothetical protein